MAKNRFIVDFLFGAKKQGSFDKTFSAVSNSVKSLTKTVAGVAATYVSAQALKSVSLSALESASSLEGYRSTLNVVMKDQKKAAQMMAWAVDFANKTPFETDSIVEATVRLQSYGIDAQKTMTQIGDMAGVMNKDIMQAVEAVADAQTGELERLKEFGITKAMIEAKGAELYKNQTIVNNKGQIVDQKKFNDALFALMEERFKGGMEIQAKSYKGIMSTITGVWKTGLANMAGISGTGEIIEGSAFDAAKEGLSWVATKMQNMANAGTFEQIGRKIGGVVQTGVKYGTKVISVAKKIKDSVADTAKTIAARLEPMRPLFDGIAEKATSLGRKITDGFTRAGPQIKTLAETYIPPAIEMVGKLADAALNVADFVVNNWSSISPIIKGVATSFVAFKAMNGVTSLIGKARGLIDIFKTVKSIAGVAGKIKALGAAFKGFSGIATLLTSPIGQIALVLGVIVTVCILIYKNADKIKAAFSNLGDWIIAKVQPAVDWLNGAADWVVEKWNQAVQTVKGWGATISDAFQKFGDWIASLFSGIWDGLVSGFKGVINFFISGINALIGGANKLLSVKIPDWIPGGGKTVGIQLPTIPMLAKGGIATKPTLAMVGEGRENEAILPLSKLQSLLRGGSLASTMKSLIRRPAAVAGGGTTYQYSPQIVFNGGDKQEHEEVLESDKKRFDRWAKEREEYDRRTRLKPKNKGA